MRNLDAQRRAGKILTQTLDMIGDHVKPGVTSLELNNLCDTYIRSLGGIPGNKGYQGYPKSICASPNDVVCHGIPNKKRIREGSILNLDMSVIVDGWYADAARMYNVGEVNGPSQKLVNITYNALQRGIEQVRPGNTVGDIGAAIQEYVSSQDHFIVKEFGGHFIGQDMHELPIIPNHGLPKRGQELKVGDVLCIEPIVTNGLPFIRLGLDGWTVKTKLGSLAAQWEAMVLVTEDGHEVLAS